MSERAEHLTCQELVELVTDYLEVALPADETSLVEEHLNFCDGCVWYVDQMRMTIAAAERVRRHEVPGEARERLLAVFRDWKRS